ncbi:uncharacterized protein HGUI_00704 [Hanseniaspora guilliermondii]|uniref:Nitrogen permease regulator 2 n=1 Tax=Hanseniaspora guilliermondii TaxID=56406 RepID=A0A1L0AWL8_9ASCO|nr:uncharacterized protein HGUI_00704 [Hanseniaspora guilliermondii]
MENGLKNNIQDVDSKENLDPIHSIFYTQFHPLEGPKLICQFPPNSLEESSIDFSDVQNFLIPKPQLCKKLITFIYKDYRIISYPLCLRKSCYFRNMFWFNFVFVFKKNSKTVPYEPIIEKLGKLFQVLEEQSQILSMSSADMIYFKNSDADEEPSSPNSMQGNIKWQQYNVSMDFSKDKDLSKLLRIENTIKNGSSLLDVEAVITRLFLDLNNYSECLISINSEIAIDFKLFTFLSKDLKSINFLSVEHVPILKQDLNSIDLSRKLNWDQTLLKILPHINGINSIMAISRLADSDVNLVVEVIKNLVYVYNICAIIDIFQFGNQYRITNRLDGIFLKNPILLAECQKFIVSTKVDDNKSEVLLPSKKVIFQLYNSIKPNEILRDYYRENFFTFLKHNIDIRKFVVFGSVHNIIYRVYEYPVLHNPERVFSKIFQYSHDNDNSTSRKHKLKVLLEKKEPTLFSTADLKLNENSNYENTSSNLDVDFINEEFLEQIASNILSKKASESQILNIQTPNHVNPRNLLIQSKNQSNNSIMTVNRTNSTFSKRKSSFIALSQNSTDSNSKSDTNDIFGASPTPSESIQSLKTQIRIVIDCLQNVDHLDKMSALIEKEKPFVLELIAAIGKYDIIPA